MQEIIENNGKDSIEASGQMLSGQLREMTQVLEEFDNKFSKKERQLEVAKT